MYHVKSITFICLVSLEILVVVTTTPHHPYLEGRAHGPRKCNGKEIHISESYPINETKQICDVKVATNLSAEFRKKLDNKPEKEVWRDHFHCILVCQMQELELLNEKGEIIESEIEDFVKDTFPSEEASLLIPKLLDCANQFGKRMDVSGDCEKNRLIFQCARLAAREVCKLVGNENGNATTAGQ
ncbi:uncharacterized protein LOC118435002 [Folsomia candida]|uniref:Uncharacterized protein n=1 Tax=Folsomia candida TaxID=158441 RepID=A0A226EKM0_FOLCA|nr:uncharacterized protein LOC118435002 [Folsomia candida]OXA57657.1 hypothetical protein Fcan01_08389 [Folsomia candida]